VDIIDKRKVLIQNRIYNKRKVSI